MFTLRANMRFLWLYLFLQTCNQWTCVNRKLNFTDELPPISAYIYALKDRMPDYWHDAVDAAAEHCYAIDTAKKYTNTCSGQSLMHCVMQKFVELCPTLDWQAKDVCAPVRSIAGYDYMFSQSRYQNLTQNLPTDRQSATFVQTYFNTKCCNIPEMFSETLTECGFKEFLHYYDRAPFSKNKSSILPTYTTTTEKIDVVDSSSVIQSESNNQETLDPLDCCELNDFIHPEWRSECEFKMTWDDRKRLIIQKDTEVITTTTESVRLDEIVIKQLPISCDKLQCVFGKLKIVSQDGVVDKEAFDNLLDDMVRLHPVFSYAKNMVQSICLRRPLLGYDGNCEIHKLLSCTFDVLSENCPSDKKGDLCKLFSPTSDLICQVSSSKFGSSHRRQFCNLPELVIGKELLDCGRNSISVIRTEPVKTKPLHKTDNIGSCTQLTKSTSCILNKMGALNKYGFMDHFRMKDKIREYSNGLTSNLYDFYNSALQNTPFYCRQCISPRKFLNVLDSMLMICPIPRRNTSEHCNKMFNDLRSSIPDDITRRKLQEMLSEFHNVYFPIPKAKKDIPQPKVKNYNLYDFGILSSKNAPPVEIIDLKPQKNTLVLLPVYQRESIDPLALTSLHNDDILRG